MDTRLRRLERAALGGDYEAYLQLCRAKGRIGIETVWTQLSDAHSHGYAKTPYEDIYIEARKDIAGDIYKERFGASIWSFHCSCCGHGYTVEEYESLAQATAYGRNCLFHEGFDKWVEEPRRPNTRYREDEYKTIEEYALRSDVLIITQYDFSPQEALISLRDEDDKDF